jgi:predicted permease
LIGAGYSGRKISVPGYTPQGDKDLNVAFNVISPKFFETAGISLLAGREFGPGDVESAPKVAIVNNKFTRFYFGGENPIGRRFALPSKEQFEIVGVVEDAKYFQLRSESPRTVFVPFLQFAGTRLERMVVAVRTATDPASVAGTLRREIQSIAKDVPIHSVGTQEQQIDATLVRERLLATLSGFFSLLALLLACVGLYGVMSYTVAQRTREIGVRIALGAQRHEVLWLVLRQSLKLVAIGLVIGVPAALASGQLVSSQLYGLSANDAATIVLAVSLLSVVALVAGYVPARRASKVDPMVALRYE